MEEKSGFFKAKKLAPFFRQDTPPLKKTKSVVSFLASSSVEERLEFFHAQHSQVYSVVLDAMQKLDMAKKVDDDDVFMCLDLVSDLMLAIKSKIQAKWQAKSILILCLAFIDKDKKDSYRIKGTQLLLQFVDILAMSEVSRLDSSMTKAISCIPDFLPFCEDSDLRNTFQKLISKPPESFRFAKREDPISKETSVKILQAVLDFVLSPNRDSSINFWTRVLTEHIFKFLYPLAFSEPNRMRFVFFGVELHSWIQTCLSN
jgi:hypothetical protein